MIAVKQFFDTSVFIRALEAEDARAREILSAALLQRNACTSAVTITEYCTGCYRHQNPAQKDRFLKLIRDFQIEIMPITENTALLAAKIRGDYLGLKTMDALQLAAAENAHAMVFYTGDRQLKQYGSGSMEVSIV